MRPCHQCRAPIENSFVLCPHCRAPQGDVWQKPSPAPEPKRPRTGRRLLSFIAFPSDAVVQRNRRVLYFLVIFVLPMVAGAVIGYSENGTSGAVVGMLLMVTIMIVVAFLCSG